MRPFEDGLGADGELGLAVAATVVAETLPLAGSDAAVATAVRAYDMPAPAVIFEELAGGLRVREHLEHFQHAYRHPVFHLS